MKTVVLYTALILMGAILQNIYGIISERFFLIRIKNTDSREAKLNVATDLIFRKLKPMLAYIRVVSKCLGLELCPLIGGLGTTLVAMANDMKEGDNAGDD